jgi:hypothetical protein
MARKNPSADRLPGESDAVSRYGSVRAVESLSRRAFLPLSVEKFRDSDA